MRNFRVEEKLRRVMQKLANKEPKKYNILLKKIDEILNCDNVEHYKNLRTPLQHLKRVQINTHFVLTFRYEKTSDVVIFYDFDHHDNIYR